MVSRHSFGRTFRSRGITGVESCAGGDAGARRVVVGALLNAVYEADARLPGGRVVFLLDEVARLGFMSSLARARDAGRKYGITLARTIRVRR